MDLLVNWTRQSAMRRSANQSIGSQTDKDTVSQSRLVPGNPGLPNWHWNWNWNWVWQRTGL